jgi:glycosyltransferase involved in cell wall biosynthesis
LVVSEYNDKRIRYISLPENCGAGVARNRGLELCRAELIAFQDSDDEWLPKKLERQINILNSAPESVGMVYTDMLHRLLDGSTRAFKSPDVKCGSIINESGLEFQVWSIGQQTTLIRKNCFEEVGFFDTTLARLIDLDFFVRLVLKFEAIHIKEPLVIFYENDKGISSNKRAGIEARLILLQKYAPYIDNYFRASQYTKIADIFMDIGNNANAFYYIVKSFYAAPLSTLSLKALFRGFKNLLYRRS